MNLLLTNWKELQSSKATLPYYLFFPSKVLHYFEKEHESQLIDNFSPTNQQLVQIFEILFVLKYQLEQLKIKLSTRVLKNSSVSTDNATFPMLNLFQQWEEYFKNFIRFIIDSTLKLQDVSKIPRALRLATKLNCSENEVIALFYILVSQSGIEFPALIDSVDLPKIATIAKFSGMNSQECLNFFHEDSVLLKQNLLLLDTEYRDTLSNSIIKMPKEVVNILIGSTFSDSDILKLDKTCIIEVLSDEGIGISSLSVTKSRSSEEELEEIAEEELSIDNVLSEDESAEFDIYKYMNKDQEKLQQDAKTKTFKSNSSQVKDSILSPYERDVDYLDDYFQWIATLIKIKNLEMDKKDAEEEVTRYGGSNEKGHETKLRELRAKERMLQAKCEKRLELTNSLNQFIPRLERLAQVRKFDDYEKKIVLLLVGSVVCHDIIALFNSGFSINRTNKRDISVGFVLFLFSDTLEERLNSRRYFYKKAPLIRDGIITLSDQIASDLMNCSVDIDRRMLDYCIGLDYEFSELLEGSHLYFPKPSIDSVVLPSEMKTLIVNTVTNFEVFKKVKKKYQIDEAISYGTGLVLLFYGPPGTGKTMMANAIANYLNKKILLINFGQNIEKTGDLLRFIFRESKINDAILFFDECETFFQERSHMSSNVASLLTEIERHDGLVIMATNRAQELDEAMQRRIQLALEFKQPDPLLRQQIWLKHIPNELKLEESIDFEKLSLNYELSGGLIKNAVISALSLAVARDGEQPIVRMEDLENGCKLQLRGSMQKFDFEKRIVPSHGLDDLVVEKSLKATIRDLIQFEKARKVLFGQWGFSEKIKDRGQSILIYGPSGVGKSLIAEVIGFELGQNLKVVEITELLSKYVESTSKSIANLLKEVQQSGGILVFELSLDISPFVQSMNLLMTNLENYNGLCIFITNLEEVVNENFAKKFKLTIEVKNPSAELRIELWKKIMPSKLPLAEDVNVVALAKQFDFNGGNISNVIFRAAAKAALAKDANNRRVTMGLLEECCRLEQEHSGKFISSNARAMFH